MPEFISNLTVKAPAKINLHLAVKDRRVDGFHNLESLFFSVDFYDILYFRLSWDEKLIKIDMKGLKFNLKEQDNIIFKAISLFREKAGFNKGLEVSVEKNIPSGGGLGGGSSDAAAALLALNKMAGFPLAKETLLEMGATLGSDVPFFLHEIPAAWVTGRGEQIKPLNSVPQIYIVLVNPGFSSNTTKAFRLLDENREQRTGDRGQEIIDCLELKDSLFDGNLFSHFFNDFLDVFDGSEKEAYDKIISNMYKLGAVYSNLSGAGSTCFGVFKEKETARGAAVVLRECWEFVVDC